VSLLVRPVNGTLGSAIAIREGFGQEKKRTPRFRITRWSASTTASWFRANKVSRSSMAAVSETEARGLSGMLGKILERRPERLPRDTSARWKSHCPIWRTFSRRSNEFVEDRARARRRWRSGRQAQARTGAVKRPSGSREPLLDQPLAATVRYEPPERDGRWFSRPQIQSRTRTRQPRPA
jgi:hypothetical protein